jgi:hypothetical protein
MKNTLTKLCSPILNIFETDVEPANYRNSHRTALKILGALFIFLSSVSGAAAFFSNTGLGALIPISVFFSVGLVALIIGALGSNGAVSKIWGTK